jgi:GNAT superfamily N-acetyltransferase
MIQVIPWKSFQEGIAPLWKVEDPITIPILNNPFQIIQYPLAAWRDKIIFFPCRFIDPKTKDVLAYTSIYNLSDEVLRIRGIYVLPEHRGKGVGHKIWQAAADLFPSGFHRVFGFWREDSAPGFIKNSDMGIVPGTDWFWSDFSGVNMRFLYRDRGARVNDLTPNQLFLAYQHERYGIGGTNNLNRTWTDGEWREFAEPAEHAYAPMNVDLDFR